MNEKKIVDRISCDRNIQLVKKKLISLGYKPPEDRIIKYLLQTTMSKKLFLFNKINYITELAKENYTVKYRSYVKWHNDQGINKVQKETHESFHKFEQIIIKDTIQTLIKKINQVFLREQFYDYRTKLYPDDIYNKSVTYKGTIRNPLKKQRGFYNILYDKPPWFIS